MEQFRVKHYYRERLGALCRFRSLLELRLKMFERISDRNIEKDYFCCEYGPLKEELEQDHVGYYWVTERRFRCKTFTPFVCIKRIRPCDK